LYTLESRIAFAGWTEDHIKNYKGPTPEIVGGLAENVRAKLGSTFTISESGTAGPTGGTSRNRTPYVSSSVRSCIALLILPVILSGYVALAVSSKAGTVTREVETGMGTDREANMVAFATEALKLLRDCLTGRAQAEL
jgi:nicotinamide mononucleotide (NMN) deamidase PncC